MLLSIDASSRRPSLPGVIASIGIGVAMALSGCATVPGVGPAPPAPKSTAPVPRNAEPPPPKINLSGFPLAYRQGYADGCASATGAQRRDGERFGKDTDYSMGWQDGIALCKKR